ncbi:MAG: hypothetical protein WD467_02765 [Candidatus Saccharimonadales bacterium]
MDYAHPKKFKEYEDRYDRITVDFARRDFKYFLQFRDEWFKIMPDEKPDSFRSTFHLNWIYMMVVGNALVDRYYKRDETIAKWIAEDEAKDLQISSSRLSVEPNCQHCGKQGLRIIDKTLMNRGEDYKYDDPEEVLFMLKCPHCDKNSAFWEDGAEWERRHTYCPKCKAIMEERTTRLKTAIKTKYSCPKCQHSYQDKLDLIRKKEKPDPDFEDDRRAFCLLDEKVRQEHIDAKHRLEGMVQLDKELKEKEDNKHIYDAVAQIKKLKIPELSEILSPVLEKAGYIEFSLDKPEMGRDVFIGFSCLDGKNDRDDYDSRKTLKKLVNKALNDTNWRLTSDGITYRLGYLSGRVRAYENEEDIKKLVMKSKNLKSKQTSSQTNKEKSSYPIKGKDGRDIIL